MEEKGGWNQSSKRWFLTEPFPLIEEHRALPESIMDRYYLVCSRIIMLNPIFRKFKDPTLSITLQKDPKGIPKADIEFMARNANFDNIIQL